MNEETENMMLAPRCGYKDVHETNLQKRIRRYVLLKSKWQHLNLTYSISKFSKKLTKREVELSAAAAFKV